MLFVSSVVSSIIIISLLLVRSDPFVSVYSVVVFMVSCIVIKVKLAVSTRTTSSKDKYNQPSFMSRVKLYKIGDISSGITIVALKAPVTGIDSTELPVVSNTAPSVIDMYVVSLSIAKFSMILSLFVSLLDNVRTT